MKNKLVYPLFVLIASLVAGVPAFPHHGMAAYDDTKLVTIRGTVSEFQFSNPHAQLFLDAKDDRGNIEKWVGEGASPNMLVRAGWDRKTLRPGDSITATGYRARNGANSLRIQKVTLPSGRELSFEGPGRT